MAKKLKKVNGTTEIMGERVKIDLLHDFTVHEIKSMLRKGIEHFYRNEDYGKNFRQLIGLYCEVTGILPAEKKREETTYGEVMFIEDDKDKE